MIPAKSIYATVVALVVIISASGADAASGAVEPYENSTWSTPANAIDEAVTAALSKQGISLRNPCSDAVFIRRVYFDAIGTLPPAKDVDAFLRDKSLDKRAKLIDSLLARPEFADYWSMKWCDLLRVKSEFPINLWPNAVQAYSKWIHDQISRNRPYDQFVRELLTANGSNFRVPPANFYRAVQGRDAASLAKAVALTFMGVRFENWPQAKRDQMAAFFSEVAYKGTDEWKEEIVYVNPTSSKALKVVFPDGSKGTIPAGADPRQAFANWLISPKNPWFARNIVNRMWAWTMGHGIIDQPDDIRPDNPPASPEALTCLEREFVKSNYDLKHMFALIFNSRTYQQSSIPHNDTTNPKVLFAHYKVRQLDAEVLIDALCWIGGNGESYSSPIPEPYTFIPKDQRTIALADGSITSTFLTRFGRPSRDTGLESERNNQPSDTQRLFMLNSSDIQTRIDKSPRLQAVMSQSWRNPTKAINGVYLVILSRYPTSDELAAARNYQRTTGLPPKQAMGDVAWALINSKEFLCRH